MNLQPEDSKSNANPGLGPLILTYLSVTPIWILFIHFVYVLMICLTLTISYVAAFHWSSLIEIYKEAHDVKSFGTNLKVSVESNNKIQSMLSQLLSIKNSTRAYVFRFHNGIAAVNGVPFFFQSDIQEVIAPGVTRIMQFNQRIPVGINIESGNDFVQDKCYVITNTDLNKDSIAYYYYQTRGAKTMIHCPITIVKGDLFGYVGIDFSDNKTKDEIDAITNTLKEQAKQLGEIYSSTIR